MPNIHAMTCELPPGDETGECAVCASLLDEVGQHTDRLMESLRRNPQANQSQLGDES